MNRNQDEQCRSCGTIRRLRHIIAALALLSIFLYAKSITFKL
jgi:hypothetical protein